MENKLWWKHGVVYQIYPRSFADGNGDGTGDLKGIIEHLDYLNDGTPGSLGIDAIWLSPIYPSPMHDFGYDISDYRQIDPVFGTLEEFDRLINEAHRRGISIIMDLVVNHTSHLHQWFIESRSSRDNPKRDWYIWRDTPNNWESIFGGPAWEKDEATGQYYLHIFLPQQPDLNWRNTEVLKAVTSDMKFWLDRGVDGFRLDVADRYCKDALFRDNPKKMGLRAYDRQKHIYDQHVPETIEIHKKFRMLFDEYSERMSVGEVFGDEETVGRYLGNGDGLHTVFNFNLTDCHWKARAFNDVVKRWEKSIHHESWPCYALSNHDVARHYSRYGEGGWSDARAKVASAMLLTLRGTPFLYYGEEIGMREAHIPRKEIQDPPGKLYWPFYKGRDGCRTPMQWNKDMGDKKYWIRVGKEYKEVNVDAQTNDQNSLLSFYRSLIWLRKSTPALFKGNYTSLTDGSDGIWLYLREAEGKKVMVCLNFTRRPKAFKYTASNGERSRFSVLLSTTRQKGDELEPCSWVIQPYEATICEI